MENGAPRFSLYSEPSELCKQSTGWKEGEVEGDGGLQNSSSLGVEGNHPFMGLVYPSPSQAIGYKIF